MVTYFLFSLVLNVVSYPIQDPEKGPVPAFLPFQRSVSADDEPEVDYKKINYYFYRIAIELFFKIKTK